jgi:hypothetical protein
MKLIVILGKASNLTLGIPGWKLEKRPSGIILTLQ